MSLSKRVDDNRRQRPSVWQVLQLVPLGFMPLVMSLGLSSVSPALAQQSTAAAFTSGYRWDSMRHMVGEIKPAPSGTAGPFLAMRYTYDADEQLIKTESGYLAAWADETIAPSAWSNFTVEKVTLFSYDAVGNKIDERVTDPSGGVRQLSQMSYDADDRLQCSAVRMNLTTVPPTGTSACVLQTSGSWGSDRISKNVYDAAGQLLQTRRAVGTPQEQAYATYAYSSNGKQTDVVDADGNHTRYVYDGLDRQIKWIFPSSATLTASALVAFTAADPATALTLANTPNAPSTSGAGGDYEQYSYDNNGNRLQLRKRDGQLINYTYDALNRVSNKTFANTTSVMRNVYYTYDNLGHELSATFDSPTGVGVTRSYDAVGRLKSNTDATSGFTRSLVYTYDADSNRTQIQHPDGQVFGYDYDALDRMSNAYQGPVVNGYYLTRYDYDSYGRVGDVYNRMGNYSSFRYDGISRLQQIVQIFASNANITTTSLGYNAASQIASRSTDDDAYAFNGLVNVNRSYTPNGLNQYAAVNTTGYTYDANGNLRYDGTNTYTYDTENRLVSVSGGRSATLTYDPLGRLSSVSGVIGGVGTFTSFLYDGDALIAEYDGSNNLTKRYIHGAGVDDPLVAYTGSGFAAPSWLHRNWQGSIIAFTDAAGNRAGVNSYDEYGFPGAANTGRFQYTGQIWIPEIGMYHYKARVYSPVLGRFLQTDPIGYKDDLDLYTYVGDDPIDGRDPSGNCAEDACVVEGGVGVGVYAGYLFATGACAITQCISKAYEGVKNAVEHIVHQNEAPPVPDGNVGTPPHSDGKGGQTQSGPLHPDHGGTGDPDKDFGHLTGGTGKPNETGGRPPGTKTGDNGVQVRPGKPGQGPRIDIPPKGNKPGETLHYPPRVPPPPPRQPN